MFLVVRFTCEERGLESPTWSFHRHLFHFISFPQHHHHHHNNNHHRRQNDLIPVPAGLQKEQGFSDTAVRTKDLLSRPRWSCAFFMEMRCRLQNTRMKKLQTNSAFMPVLRKNIPAQRPILFDIKIHRLHLSVFSTLLCGSQHCLPVWDHPALPDVGESQGRIIVSLLAPSTKHRYVAHLGLFVSVKDFYFHFHCTEERGGGRRGKSKD